MTVTTMLNTSSTPTSTVNSTSNNTPTKINLPPISDILLPPMHHHHHHHNHQSIPPQHQPHLIQQPTAPIQTALQPPQLRVSRSLLPPINANGNRYLPSHPTQVYEGNNNYYYGSSVHNHGIMTPSHSLNTPPSLATRSPLSSNSSPVYGATVNIPSHHQQQHPHHQPTQHITSSLASPPLRQSQSHHTLYQRQVPGPGYVQIQHQQGVPPTLYKTHSSPPMGLNIRNGSIGESSEDDEDEYSNSENKNKLQANSSDGNGKRKTRNNLPKEITYILLKWLNDHLNHPYPNSFEKNQLMMATGLNQQQLSNWFINARRRKIKSLKEQKRISL
ncbi:hypothetical protein DFJ63DRAFT_320779, partial [Scheffersomyces coipomensis]|uniref:uncharacterized protein n=1 Tax=Scheffersomyces coipomensis TaxID=1788519 RepID=UPI00315D8720